MRYVATLAALILSASVATAALADVQNTSRHTGGYDTSDIIFKRTLDCILNPSKCFL